MTRQEAEDQILQLIESALDPEVWVAPMPVLADKDLGKVHRAAVWLVYRGAKAGKNGSLGGVSQREDWAWSVLVLAKSYRSQSVSSHSALELLESVEDAVCGKDLGTGPVTKVSDRLLDLPLDTALIGYDLQIIVPNYIRRML